MSFKTLLISTIYALIASASITACSDRGHSSSRLSEEQAEHEEAIKSCINSRAAGVHWYEGDQLGNYCERAHPSRTQQARTEIVNLLKIYNLVPEWATYPELLPEGDCKALAQRYVQLNDAAYHLNSGPAKDTQLSEAAALDATVRQGSCVQAKTPRSNG